MDIGEHLCLRYWGASLPFDIGGASLPLLLTLPRELPRILTAESSRLLVVLIGGGCPIVWLVDGQLRELSDEVVGVDLGDLGRPPGTEDDAVAGVHDHEAPPLAAARRSS